MKGDLALGRVRTAIARLASVYPLHAGILAQWQIGVEPAVGTMGVGFREGRLRLVFNPAFVEGLKMDELMGLLHHEVNHVMFGHVLHVPGPDENRTARTIAEEVTVNEWVAEPLPAGAVLLADYRYLPKNEDTDTRYKRLRKRVKDTPNAMAPVACQPLGRSASSEGGSAGQGARSRSESKGADPRTANGSGSSKGQGAGHGADAKSKADGTDARAHDRSGSSEGRGAGQGAARRPSANGVPTIDNHDTWAEIQADPEAAKASINMDIALAWGGLTDEQKAGLSDPFESRARQAGEAVGLGLGDAAGDGETALGAGEARVRWQDVLRRHVGQIRERRPVFGRPPRRFPHLVGIVPGRGRFPAKPKVMAVIDTSGSMSDEMLADISAELSFMAKRHQVLVVECDVKIHAVYPYRPIKRVFGRGGTSFRAPFAPLFLRKHRPDLVVYFTDGEGDAPENPPRVPVIWCLTEGGEKPVPWGREIHLEGPE